MAWQLYEAGFGYDFIGGFLFFDRLGSIMRAAQNELDYNVCQTGNRKELLVKKSQDGFSAKINDDYFYLSQIEPTGIDCFRGEIKKWLPIVVGAINPLSFEKSKIILDYVLPMTSKDEVFSKLLCIESLPFADIAQKTGFDKLMQNVNFVFRSGSTLVECSFFGRAFNIPTPSRQSLDFFNTRRQDELNTKSLLQKQTHAGIEFSWAIGLKVSAIEETPPVPSSENNFAFERIIRLMQIAEKFHDSARKVLKK